MKGWFLIERADGTEYFVCKKCGHSADVPYDRCPECGGEETMINKAHLRPKDFDNNGDIIPMACKEEKGDCISREALRKKLTPIKLFGGAYCKAITEKDIDDAPPIETDIEVIAKDAYEQGYTDGWKERFGEPDERPQGEWIYTTHHARRYRICPFCKSEKEDDRSEGWFYCWHCGAKMKKEGAKNGENGIN